MHNCYLHFFVNIEQFQQVSGQQRFAAGAPIRQQEGVGSQTVQVVVQEKSIQEQQQQQQQRFEQPPQPYTQF